MSRAKKLLIVSFVLAIGIGLSLPFRRQPGEHRQVPSGERLQQMSAFENSAPHSDPALPKTAGNENRIRRQVEAHMASTRDGDSAKGFDLEGHPALAGRPTTGRNEKPLRETVSADESPVTPQTRPAYATSQPEADEAAWPEEVIHVVHNGDTLEKLAERYLGDEGRAMELFDLNREHLSNPHLLPIGAELRIPVPARREND